MHAKGVRKKKICARGESEEEEQREREKEKEKEYERGEIVCVYSGTRSFFFVRAKIARTRALDDDVTRAHFSLFEVFRRQYESALANTSRMHAHTHTARGVVCVCVCVSVYIYILSRRRATERRRRS